MIGAINCNPNYCPEAGLCIHSMDGEIEVQRCVRLAHRHTQMPALWLQVNLQSQSSPCHCRGLWHPLLSPHTNLTKTDLTNSQHSKDVIHSPCSRESRKKFCFSLPSLKTFPPTSPQGHAVEMWERVTAWKSSPWVCSPSLQGQIFLYAMLSAF